MDLCGQKAPRHPAEESRPPRQIGLLTVAGFLAKGHFCLREGGGLKKTFFTRPFVFLFHLPSPHPHTTIVPKMKVFLLYDVTNSIRFHVTLWTNNLSIKLNVLQI